MMRQHRSSRHRNRRARQIRDGFTLVEIIVSMTMLAVILVSIAKVSTQIAVRGRSNALVANRTAALQLEASKFGAMPYDNLATWSTANRTFTSGTFSYTRRLTITNSGTNRYTIKIVVIPTLDASKTDSLTFDRTRPPSGSPLCTTC